MNKTKLYTSNISYWVAIVFYYLGIHNDVLLRSDDYIFGVCNGLMLTPTLNFKIYQNLTISINSRVQRRPESLRASHRLRREGGRPQCQVGTRRFVNNFHMRQGVSLVSLLGVSFRYGVLVIDPTGTQNTEAGSGY